MPSASSPSPANARPWLSFWGCRSIWTAARGPRAQSARAFARNLARLTDLPIALWDERLSTVAVERELIAADMSRARRAEVIDQHAAAFILQGALDRLRRLDEAGTGG